MTSTKYFIGGMNSDDAPTYISDDSYTYALNAMLESSEGQFKALSVEKGNTEIANLPDGYSIIGSITTNENYFIWFLVDSKGNGIIAEFNPNKSNNFNELIKSKNLNFSSKHPVQGIFRLRNGCERIIYFTDRVNPFRVINLDKLDQYKNSLGDWDVNTFKLNRTFNLATLNNVTINNNGGVLRVGAYQFCYRYTDFDGNPTNWSPLSKPVYVVDDSSNFTFDLINGSVDAEYYNSEEGGVPFTSKSITIRFTDVDKSYKYIEVAVVKSLEGLGIPTETVVLPKRPITQSNVVINYTGVNETKTDLNAVITDKEAIETVGTLAHVNSNMYLGNVSLKNHSWATFQRAASKIVTTLKVNKVEAYNAEKSGNSKSGENSLAFVDDEVYALGIVYIMKDGTYSPVFHIPGRSAINDERNLVTTWTSDVSPWASNSIELQNNYAQVEDEITSKQVLRRFHVYNTGTSTSLGYYESNQTYPKLLDCDGKSVWGVDSNGIQLEGKNIRYHKLPSRREIPLLEQTLGVWYLNKLEFEFSNIELPSEEVQSYFFVQAKRGEEDRTVVDQGMLNSTLKVNGKLFSEGDQEYHTYRPERGTGDNRQGGVQTDVLAYNSARTLSEKRTIPHDYIKILGFYQNPNRVNRTERYSTPGFLSGRIEALVSNYQRNNVGFTLPLNNRLNVRSEDMAIISPTSFQNAFGAFTAGLYNSLASHSVCFIKAETNSLSSIQVSNSSPGALLTWFVSLKSTREVYSDLFNLEYIPLQGDWIITPLDMFQILVTDPSGFLSGGDADATYISHTWMTSPVNFGLKYWGTSDNKRHFDGNIQKGPDYLISRVGVKTENNKYEIKKLEEVVPEFIGINKDFSKLTNERIYYPLELTYDFCNKCENLFPNRIYYSKKDNLESNIDNYRIFLANNYRNLDGYGEEIVQLLVDKDELYALCNNYTYYIPTRNQEVKTDTSVAYIGTGSELSIPPKRLSSTNYSYGGCDNPLSVITTEFGSFWVDAKGGRIFKLSDSLAEISAIKMSRFFRNNLPIQIAESYKKATGENYQTSWQVTDKEGVGIICGYDPQHSRLIVHKKDYSPNLPLSKFSERKGSGFIYVKNSKFYSSADEEISLTDTRFFKNKSFTISFSLKENKWISFHSYHPEFLINDHRTFYSLKTSKVYEHNLGEHKKFYNKYQPFELETVFNKPFNQNKEYESVSISGPMLYSNDREGISHIWLYNDLFSTGKLKVKSYSNGFLSLLPTEAAQRLISEKYNISNFRDNSNTGVRTKWVSTIDLDRSPTEINFNKSVWDKTAIQGKYIYVKLYAEENIDQLISFDAIEINQKILTR